MASTHFHDVNQLKEVDDKISDLDDRVTDLEDGGSTGLPPGGITGQALRKASTADGDAIWQNINEVPAGGGVRQVLMKNALTSYDYSWRTIESGMMMLRDMTYTSGGSQGYMLVAIDLASVERLTTNASARENFNILDRTLVHCIKDNDGKSRTYIIRELPWRYEIAPDEFQFSYSSGGADWPNELSVSNAHNGWLLVAPDYSHIVELSASAEMRAKFGVTENTLILLLEPNDTELLPIMYGLREQSGDPNGPWFIYTIESLYQLFRRALPAGGTTGQVLRRNMAATNLQHLGQWTDVNEVPAGGTTNQVLTKTSGADYDYNWMNSASLSVADGAQNDLVLRGLNNNLATQSQTSFMSNNSIMQRSLSQTMTANLVAGGTQNILTDQVRNIRAQTADITPGSTLPTGNIILKYEV